MFELDRTFSQRCAETGLMKWYFNAREGIFGPYDTKQMALDGLNIFVERRVLAEDDGGRGKAIKDDGKLAMVPIEHTLEPMFFDYAKKKKGIDEE
ncbi:MAG: hypothetical protein Q8N30_08140 [Methylococcales bacterium]|jgi:hypothetical protein|nr:hypothetical protein [Methylococcales bacterium]